MKKKEIDHTYKGSSKEYLIALTRYPGFTKLINPENKPYKLFYDWLMKNEKEFLDEDRVLPSIKDISKLLSIDNNKITKYLRMIYDEIIELNNEKPELFVKPGQLSCYLSFEYFKNYLGLTLGLNVLPRVGECFQFYFTKPKTDGWNFYVRRVDHEYYNNGHELYISLSYQSPNHYLNLLREKAYLHRDISLHEYFTLSDYELENELLKIDRRYHL